MIVNIDLDKQSVFRVRNVDNRALQCTGTQQLTDNQVLTLKKIISKMPVSAESNSDLNCVFVAFQHDGKVDIRKYLRNKLPDEVQKIYDIGGGYIDTTKGEQPGAGQPATKPADKVPPKDQPPTPTSKGTPR